MHLYHPQRSCGKVMFLHLSVILFTGGEGVSGRHPPGRQPLFRHPMGRHPGRHTPRWPLQQTVRILLECILVVTRCKGVLVVTNFFNMAVNDLLVIAEYLVQPNSL